MHNDQCAQLEYTQNKLHHKYKVRLKTSAFSPSKFKKNQHIQSLPCTNSRESKLTTVILHREVKYSILCLQEIWGMNCCPLLPISVLPVMGGDLSARLACKSFRLINM